MVEQGGCFCKSHLVEVPGDGPYRGMFTSWGLLASGTYAIAKHWLIGNTLTGEVLRHIGTPYVHHTEFTDLSKSGLRSAD
jgi:hypothetical protein